MNAKNESMVQQIIAL